MVQSRAMPNSSHTLDSHVPSCAPAGVRRAPRWLLGLGSLLLLAQAGCPSDSKGPSPKQQCEALKDDICDKLVSCAGKLTGEKLTEADHQDCLDSIMDSDSDCDKAVRVSDDYPTCVDAIQDATCDDVYSVNDDDELVVNDLPSVCEEVILTR